MIKWIKASLLFCTPTPAKFSLNKSKISAMICAYVEVTCSYYTKIMPPFIIQLFAISMTAFKIWCITKSDTWLLNIATHSSILAWRIPWAEKPGRL